MILSDFDLRGYISSGRLYIEPYDPSIVRENGLDLRLGSGYCELLEADVVLDPYSHTDLSSFYKCGEAMEFILKPWGRGICSTLSNIQGSPRSLRAS